MDIYAILCVIIQYHLIIITILLKLFKLWSLRSPSVGSYVSLIYSSIVGLFKKHFVDFWQYKMLQAHLVYSFPSP